MPEKLNRPVIALAEDGQRFFAEPPKLLSRVTLSIALYDLQTRAEMKLWEPGATPEGHVIWEHHIRTHNPEPGVHRSAARTLGQTGEWLARNGYPGLPL